MNGLPIFVTPLDWSVVAAYLGAVTLLAWLTKGGPRDRTAYFLAARTLPWPVASASLVATELGVVAFLLVPAAMLDWHGDGTHLQWAIGAIATRIVVAAFVVKRYFDGEHETPYDFIGARLGRGAKVLAVSLFALGGLLAHSARLFLGASALALVSPLPLGWCVILFVVIGLLWALPGGIRTVAWTNAANLLVFIAAGAAALWWTVDGFDGGWATLFETARTAENFDRVVAEKLKVFDFGFGAGLEFSFWTALFAAPFLQVSALSADHTQTQAFLSCRGQHEARKAVLGSILGQFVVLLMTLLGLSLFAFYRLHPPTDPMVLKALKWSGGTPADLHLAFPVWFVTEMPQCWRGLLLSGLVAATISGLSSFIVALAHVGKQRRNATVARADGVNSCRKEVVFYGVLVGVAAFFLHPLLRPVATDPFLWIHRISLFSAGPLLAILLAALAGRGRAGGLALGTAVSMLIVVLTSVDLYFLGAREALGRSLADFRYELVLGRWAILGSLFSLPWAWPLTTLVTLLCGWDYRRKKIR